jgi:predicted enzyme related to lactoylglutathione lyase
VANRLVHLELHTGDLGGAWSFYGGLFDWELRDVRAGASSYREVNFHSALGGGVVECATPVPRWLPYVQVEGIDDAVERARELGARVLLEPREGPAGWRSVIATPDAGEVALWLPKRPD